MTYRVMRTQGCNKGDGDLFNASFEIQVSLQKKYTKMEYGRRTAMFISAVLLQFGPRISEQHLVHNSLDAEEHQSENVVNIDIRDSEKDKYNFALENPRLSNRSTSYMSLSQFSNRSFVVIITSFTISLLRSGSSRINLCLVRGGVFEATLVM